MECRWVMVMVGLIIVMAGHIIVGATHTDGATHITEEAIGQDIIEAIGMVIIRVEDIMAVVVIILTMDMDIQRLTVHVEEVLVVVQYQGRVTCAPEVFLTLLRKK